MSKDPTRGYGGLPKCPCFLGTQHYTAFLKFNAKEYGDDMELKATYEKDAKFYVKVTWDANEDHVDL